MRRTTTQPWDAADHLKTEEDMVAYLDAALEEFDLGLIAAALGDIARAKGMTNVAADAGLGRESLYKSLSVEGNPAFDTVLKVTRALGIRLRATSLAAEPLAVGRTPHPQGHSPPGCRRSGTRKIARASRRPLYEG